ncbi:molecular chaperone [Shewanella mangrovi]|uniref:Guanidinium exporter n=1 Tax=Shewanella mangrovi TaxID=1515746 RepID=A0A094JMA0_9GAMM|nr:multidrug efflux SMR transporter [Shewanella mangrovi]KFZ39179.1 molecular chaperone [Shewanella mangrovi]
MAWVILVFAGLSEIAWAIGLKYSAGFSQPVASLITIICLVLSFVLLGVSLKSLPLSLAYGVWVGIGTIGSVIAGALLFGEQMNAVKLVSILLIMAGIVGIKLSSS